MSARENFSLEIRHPFPPVADLECWVLLPGPCSRPVVRRREAVPVGPTAQDLVWLRDWLLFAYLAPTGYRETERPPEPDGVGVIETGRLRDAFPRQRASVLAECPLDGDAEAKNLPFDYVATLARDTTRVTCSETRKKKKSAIPLGPTAFEDAHLVRTVATLPTELSRWIRYAYADSLEWDDQAGCVMLLWSRVQAQLGKMQAKTLQRAKGLAHLAVQHHKFLKNTGTPRYDGPELSILLGVTEVNYRQHWAARWDAMQSSLDGLDTEALSALWKRL